MVLEQQRPRVSNAATDVRAGCSCQDDIVEDDEAVLQHSHARVFNDFAIIVETRCAENDIVGLPLQRRFAGVNEGRELVVNRTAIAHARHSNPVGIQDLDFIPSLEEHAAVTLGLSCCLRHIGCHKFKVQEMVGKPFGCHNVAGARDDSHHAVFHFPAGFAAIAGSPIAQVTAVKENDCGFWWCVSHRISFWNAKDLSPF